MNVLNTVIVGSGCSASMAAQTLVGGGEKVTMIDVGVQNHYKPVIPNKDYLSIRKEEPNQYEYFLGKNAEEAHRSKVAKGAQITAPRNYMIYGTDKYIPLKSDTFSPLESLGYGGLGISWGLQCWEYSHNDLVKVGLDTSRMHEAYNTISKRIGISATADSAAAYTIGDLDVFQPSPNMDRNHSQLYRKYLNKQSYFNKRGVYIGRTPLALLTKDMGKRKAYQYQDMDFYSDQHLSAWRPYITVDELRKRSNFEYIGDHLVTSFTEKSNYIIVSCLNTKTDKKVNFYCRKLILSAGALGTARIILRSLGTTETKLPLLSNPHTYIPCLQNSMVGKGVEKSKLGFGQLSIFIDKEGTGSSDSVASSYSYQSLMLHRIIREVPLDLRATRKILQYLTPGLVIMIVQHADSHSKDKYLRLVEDSSTTTGDILQAKYKLTDEEDIMGTKNEKQYAKIMRKLNAYPIRRIKLPNGAAIHYAGTLPFSNSIKEFTLSPSGRLNGTKNIYVADSSGFNYLPAPGLTFTLMANAHIVAENVLKNG
jgi:hypothetical protein